MTQVFRKVNTDGNKQHLQNDLDRLVIWSEKWQMLFNFGKCKCLHTGHRNLNKMGDTVLGKRKGLTYLLNPLGPFRSIGRQPCFSTSLCSGLELWPLAR